LFDNFGTDSPQLVGVVDTKIAAMSFVGFQFNNPDCKKFTRYFEEMDVKERYEGSW
jgi:hypothetical protein